MTGDPIFDELLQRLTVRAVSVGIRAAVTALRHKRHANNHVCACCGRASETRKGGLRPSEAESRGARRHPTCSHQRGPGRVVK